MVMIFFFFTFFIVFRESIWASVVVMKGFVIENESLLGEDEQSRCPMRLFLSYFDRSYSAIGEKTSISASYFQSLGLEKLSWLFIF